MLPSLNKDYIILYYYYYVINVISYLSVILQTCNILNMSENNKYLLIQVDHVVFDVYLKRNLIITSLEDLTV